MGIPEPILAKIQAAIAGIDRVLPGIQKVMEVSELGIVYDEKNRHGIFHPTQRGHRGSYFWPLHMMYLANSGIKNSIAHETAHMLDLLSGPSLAETQDKYGSELIWPKSLYSFFPQGGQVILGEIREHLDPENNFSGWFLVSAVANCIICREDPQVKERLLRKISVANWADSATKEFMMERVAHLMEEYVFTLQQETGIAPLGVGGVSYFSRGKHEHLWWGKEWILENRSDIQTFFNQMIDTILQRQKTGELGNRIQEMRKEFS